MDDRDRSSDAADAAAADDDALRRDALLPAWAVAALRAPAYTDPAATAPGRARVMALVRRAPRHRFRLRAARPRWARRGVLAPAGGAALAAALAVAVGVTGPPRGPGAGDAGDDAPARAAATVLGDTVVTRTAFGRVLRDTVLDTLRIVRFVLRDPGAARVALAGDFNAWSRTATPLARDARTGAWAVTVVVPRDAVRYAFVADGRRWLAGPAPARPTAPGDSI